MYFSYSREHAFKEIGRTRQLFIDDDSRRPVAHGGQLGDGTNARTPPTASRSERCENLEKPGIGSIGVPPPRPARYDGIPSLLSFGAITTRQ